MKNIFSNHWDKERGFSYQEALDKKKRVDERYAVKDPTSRWKEAVIEPDPESENGFRVAIETKPED